MFEGNELAQGRYFSDAGLEGLDQPFFSIKSRTRALCRARCENREAAVRARFISKKKQIKRRRTGRAKKRRNGKLWEMRMVLKGWRHVSLRGSPSGRLREPPLSFAECGRIDLLARWLALTEIRRTRLDSDRCANNDTLISAQAFAHPSPCRILPFFC